jgi:zinc-ribbon domain
MKKAWKWVIGVVVVLIILAVLVGLGFVIRNNMHIIRGQAQIYRGYPERGPEMMPYGGFGYHMRGPFMMGNRWSPFGGFIRGLFMLGFLVLVVLGIIWLAGRGRTQNPVAATAAMPAGTLPAVPEEITTPCKKCGRSLQAEWKVCPYCGKKV